MNNNSYGETNFITSIRGIAILMVFIIHSLSGTQGFSDYFNSLINSGSLGVQIFFVISGFTIFYQFFTANYTYKNFLKVRLLRICIPYYPILVVMFIAYNFNVIPQSYWSIKTNTSIDLINLFMHFIFIGSFINEGFSNSILGVEWTLNVEVFYYIIIGFLIVSIRKKHYPLMIIGACGVSLLTIILYKFDFISSLYFHWQPLTYAFLFMFGGVTYYFRYKFKFDEKTKKNLSNISFVSFVIAIFMTPFVGMGYVSGVIVGLFTMLLIIFSDNTAMLTKVMLNNKFFLFIGRISFSFYLIHYPVIGFVRLFNLNYFFNFILSFVLTCVVAYVYCFIFEDFLYKKAKNYSLNKSIIINNDKRSTLE